MTNCAVAAAAILVCLASDVALVRAQDADSKTNRDADSSTSRQSAADRIEGELSKTTSVDFVESPLKDVVTFLGEHHHIPIVLSAKKLEEASISPDTPVTKTLRGIQLRSALNLILKDLELTYVIRDEVLQITTPEDAESQLVIRVYDCRDLLAMPEPHAPARTSPESGPLSPPAGKPISGPWENLWREPTTPRSGGAGMDDPGTNRHGRIIGVIGGGVQPKHREPQTELERRTDQLIEVITATVVPDSWHDVGGPASICAYNGLFTVSQTDNAHRQAEHLLDMLRKAAGIETAKGAKVLR
jgi:hypothetical protein